MLIELQFSFSAYDLMMVYIYTKFHENILKGLRAIERTRFPERNFQRGIILSDMKTKLQFFFSAHHLKMVYMCIKFCQNISKGFRDGGRTRFPYCNFQRGIIP